MLWRYEIVQDKKKSCRDLHAEENCNEIFSKKIIAAINEVKRAESIKKSCSQALRRY